MRCGGLGEAKRVSWVRNVCKLPESEDVTNSKAVQSIANSGKR